MNSRPFPSSYRDDYGGTASQSLSSVNPRAKEAKRRSGRQPGARELIPPGYLHPGKGKHL